jgi:hypothetical protein
MVAHFKGILMKSDMVFLSPPDLWVVFEFQDGSTGQGGTQRRPISRSIASRKRALIRVW